MDEKLQEFFTCGVCKEKFSSRELLREHHKIHADTHHCCVICTMPFSSIENLRSHLEIHEISTEHHLGIKRQFSLPSPPTSPKRFKVQQGGAADTSLDLESEEDTRNYDLRQTGSQFVKRFKTQGRFFKFDINLPEPSHDALSKVLSDILEDALANVDENDYVGIELGHDNLSHKVFVSFRLRREITAGVLMTNVDQVTQSQNILDGSGIFDLKILIVSGRPLITGSGRIETTPVWEEWYKRKRCFHKTSGDRLCLPQAILAGKAYEDRAKGEISDTEFWAITYAPNLISEAEKLCEKGKVDPNKVFEIQTEIPKFLEVIGDLYRVHIYSKEYMNQLVDSFGPASACKNIYVYHYDNHFEAITSMTSFHDKDYFCHDCQLAYHNKRDHSCPYRCKNCNQPKHDSDRAQWILCKQCNMRYSTQTCFDLHLVRQGRAKPICKTRKKCLTCNEIVLTGEAHKCGWQKCRYCHQLAETASLNSVIDNGSRHKCYLQPLPHTKDDKKKGGVQMYAFFDFECMQVEDDNGQKKHVPNLCALQAGCDDCFDTMDDCMRCGLKADEHEHVFRGPSTLKDFGDFLFSGKLKNVTVFAHNNSGYDGHFVLDYSTRNGYLPDVVMNGLKIMTMKFPNGIRFIDSLNYLQMPLAKFSKTFGIPVKKGHMPHLFNVPENQNYVGPLPDLKFFDPDHKKPSDRKDLIEWYEKEKAKGHTYDFQRELLSYCIDDVKLLKLGIMKFRSIFKNVTDGIDPFEQSCTIASACHKVWRTLDLNKGTVAHIPSHKTYIPHDMYSAEAIKWLEYEAHTRNINIQHALNLGEVRVGPKMRVDGYYRDEKTNTALIFEFLGCHFHGCPKHNRNENDKIKNAGGKSFKQAYEETLERLEMLKKHGTVIFMWECNFQKQLKENKEMQEFVSKINVRSPMNARDAFFGGRTECFVHHKVVEGDEKIHYVDVMSLYPYVLKTCRFPIGHPQVLFNPPTETLSDIFGIIYCEVLPPQNLRIPVLPKCVEGRLLFALCNKCAQEGMERQSVRFNQKTCEHNESERAIIGTWTSAELSKAISLGYTVRKIFQAWHFEQTACYNPSTGEKGLFNSYIDRFFALKLSAEGFPPHVQTEKQKNAYRKEVQDREGLTLPPLIEKNPGLRAVAKLCCNSQWGKLGQRVNPSKVEYVKDYKSLIDLLSDKRKEVSSFLTLSEHMLRLQWAYTDANEDYASLPATNIVLASFVTSHARLHLYSFMEYLRPEQILYCDTDSVFYSARQTDPHIAVENRLGCMTDELSEFGPGSYITEFTCLGPKNYCYSVFSTERQETLTFFKIRGITLNYTAQQNITVERFRKCLSDPTLVTRLEKINFRRLKTHEIHTVKQPLHHRMTLTKRNLLADYSTFPYGYKGNGV